MKDYVYWATEKSKCSLKHYGVKGMRWGVRRTPEQLGHRKISKGTRIYKTGDHTAPYHKKYSVHEVDRARDKRYADGEMESIFSLNQDISLPSHSTVLNTLGGIIKKNPKLVKKAMLDEANMYWDAGDIDVMSPIDGRVFDYKDAFRSLSKQGITKANTPKQEYYKLADQESRKLIEKMVDQDVKKLQKNPDDRKAYSKYFMTFMDNLPDLRNELFSQLSAQGYHAITDEDNLKDYYHGGMDSIRVFDDSVLTEIGRKKISPLDAYISKKIYDKWQKAYTNIK